MLDRVASRARRAQWQRDYRRRQREGAKLAEIPASLISLQSPGNGSPQKRPTTSIGSRGRSMRWRRRRRRLDHRRARPGRSDAAGVVMLDRPPPATAPPGSASVPARYRARQAVGSVTVTRPSAIATSGDSKLPEFVTRYIHQRGMFCMTAPKMCITLRCCSIWKMRCCCAAPSLAISS
jgi:hypothetical protein